MLILNSTDVLQLVTGSAGNIDAHVSWADNNAGTVSPNRTNTTQITTAATTTICGSPSSGQQRSARLVTVFNANASNSNLCTVQHYDGSLTEILASYTLLAGESMVLNGGVPYHFDKYGGIYQATTQPAVLFNYSTAAQGAGFSSDTYLTGSAILLPTSRPKVGTRYLLSFYVEKTAAGTATPIFTFRYGTNATTADASLATYTFAVGTVAADKAYVTFDAYFTAVGSGTSAVMQGTASMDTNLTTTGFSNAVKNVPGTTSGFDSTTANTYLGLSVNGGTSAAWTVRQVFTRLENF